MTTKAAYTLGLIDGDIMDAGFIPMMLNSDDPRGAVEQLHDGYAHGGGWNEFMGFTMKVNANDSSELIYPDDPPMRSVCVMRMRDELVTIYQGSWVTVRNIGAPANVFACARMD